METGHGIKQRPGRSIAGAARSNLPLHANHPNEKEDSQPKSDQRRAEKGFLITEFNRYFSPVHKKATRQEQHSNPQS